jgi:hypothetical protein
MNLRLFNLKCQELGLTFQDTMMIDSTIKPIV